MQVLCNNPEIHGRHMHDVVLTLTCDGRVACGGRAHDPHLIIRAVEVECPGRFIPDREAIEALEGEEINHIRPTPPRTGGYVKGNQR